jgi:predicted PurR-regulated permease PerM
MSDVDSLVDARVTRRAWKGAVAVCAVVAVAALALVFGAPAAELTRNATMKMDEPMSGEMKKEGAKKRDVKQHAEKWDPKMKAMIEKEEKATLRGSAKK